MFFCWWLFSCGFGVSVRRDVPMSFYSAILSSSWPVLFQNVKIFKNKESLRNCHSQEKPKKTGQSIVMWYPGRDPEDKYIGTGEPCRWSSNHISATQSFLTSGGSVLSATASYEGWEVPQSTRQVGDPGELIFQFKSKGRKKNWCPILEAGRSKIKALADWVSDKESQLPGSGVVSSCFAHMMEAQLL